MNYWTYISFRILHAKNPPIFWGESHWIIWLSTRNDNWGISNPIFDARENSYKLYNKRNVFWWCLFLLLLPMRVTIMFDFDSGQWRLIQIFHTIFGAWRLDWKKVLPPVWLTASHFSSPFLSMISRSMKTKWFTFSKSSTFLAKILFCFVILNWNLSSSDKFGVFYVRNGPDRQTFNFSSFRHFLPLLVLLLPRVSFHVSSLTPSLHWMCNTDINFT